MYGISARDYLNRAKRRFSENSEESLIYAVLELRCAIEARLQEILEPHQHIPEKKKNEYKIKNLSKTISTKLCDEGRGSRVIISHEKDEFVLQYIPVSTSLRTFAKKAGDYLHVAKRQYNEATLEKLKKSIQSIIVKLEENLKGNLLGPILIKKRQAVANVEVIGDDKEAFLAFSKNAVDKKLAIQISVYYFKVE